MKVRNSLKSLRGRHRDNRIVRRRGRVYVINKTRPRFKARQELTLLLSSPDLGGSGAGFLRLLCRALQCRAAALFHA